MPSPKLLVGRQSRAGAWYAVTTVTDGRQPLFRDRALARIAIEGIAHCNRAGLCTSFAWVTMPEHVHWLFALDQGSLGACVQRFKSLTARAINQHRASTGPVWQCGYYDHRLRQDEDLIVQSRYIVANPIRRGLVAWIEDYPHWWCQAIRGSDDLW